MLEVTEVQKDGFRVIDKLDGNLFIYGPKVADLRTVDYEAIAMLNVSATQELHRTIQKQTEELNQLREEKVAVQQQLTASTDANKLQDARLAAIEKQLSSGTGTGKSAGSTKLTGSRPQ